MQSSFVRVAMPVAASLGTLIYSSNSHPLLNDTKKRSFYLEDEGVAPVPGSIVPATSAELSALGPNKIVDGVSVRSPSVIENSIKSLRLSTYNYYLQAQAKFDELTKKYYSAERDITTTISSLHEKREDLLPNSIYVLVGALSGSIVARRRNILIRGIAPLVFGIAAFKIFLPETFERTRSFVWKLEKTNIPQIAQQQELIYQKAETLANDVEQGYKSTVQTANSSIFSTKKAIADFTGLQLPSEDVTSEEKK